MTSLLFDLGPLASHGLVALTSVGLMWLYRILTQQASDRRAALGQAHQQLLESRARKVDEWEALIRELRDMAIAERGKREADVAALDAKRAALEQQFASLREEHTRCIADSAVANERLGVFKDRLQEREAMIVELRERVARLEKASAG